MNSFLMIIFSVRVLVLLTIKNVSVVLRHHYLYIRAEIRCVYSASEDLLAISSSVCSQIYVLLSYSSRFIYPVLNPTFFLSHRRLLPIAVVQVEYSHFNLFHRHPLCDLATLKIAFQKIAFYFPVVQDPHL